MLKLKLPNAITTIPEAKEFLKSLHSIGAAYHCEDDANDVEFLNLSEKDRPTVEQCNQLNKLMEDIYNLPGNDGSHGPEIAFCPCGFILDEAKQFKLIDLTGRGYTCTKTRNDIWDMLAEVADSIDDEDKTEIGDLLEWMGNAEDGEEYTNNAGTEKYIRIN